MPRPIALLCCALFAAAGSAWSADDAPAGDLPPLIHRLTQQAGKFWGAAPSWYCRETLRQRGPDRKKVRHGLHISDPPAASVNLAEREIVSWYGFSAWSSNSEAVHEIRRITAVDGKPVRDPGSADDFCRLLRARDDFSKQTLVDQFREATLTDMPLDFGQLVMLFTHRAVDRYTFHLAGTDLIGAQRVTVFQYSQQTGTPGLHIDQSKVPLTGKLSLREPDGAPVRITVNATRTGKDKVEVRDEAEVDYQEMAHGVVLPVSLVHRRLIDGNIQSDDRAQYTDWKQVPEAIGKGSR